MTNTILTTKIYSGPIVLAKSTKYGIFAKTFANRTQAENAAAKVGGEVIRFGRPWFVRIEAA